MPLSESFESNTEAGLNVKLSIVLPVKNEAFNLRKLYLLLADTLNNYPGGHEIIFVEDGSHDESFRLITEFAEQDSHVIGIKFARNYGQTSAFKAGITAAQGQIIVLMDSDLQNDPSDILRLVAKLEEGFDVVSGWRKDRKDKTLLRVLPSKLANGLIALVTGVRLHDNGCSLKAYRGSILKEVPLYGDMHRFIPILMHDFGARVTELPVTHHPRVSGKSSYGLSRTFKVIVDLLLVRFLAYHSTKPIHTFGGFGLLSLFLGFGSGCVALYFKLTGQKDFVETPLPLLTVLLSVLGIISIFMGFLAEVLVRTYYESQGKVPYRIVNVVSKKTDSN